MACASFAANTHGLRHSALSCLCDTKHIVTLDEGFESVSECNLTDAEGEYVFKKRTEAQQSTPTGFQDLEYCDRTLLAECAVARSMQGPYD